MGKRKMIWLNPPLENLAQQCSGKGRDGKFSRRLGDIVERYDTIMKLTHVPEVSDDEAFILSEAICGSFIDAIHVRYLHEGILDCASGTEETRKALSQKVANWTPAERLAVIEWMGQ